MKCDSCKGFGVSGIRREIGGTARASGRCAAHERWHVEYAFRDEQIGRVFINTYRGMLGETAMSAFASISDVRSRLIVYN